MDADIKKKWIEALRSGKYKQGIGFLNNNGKYCCLGVLCEAMGVVGDPTVDGIVGYGGCFKVLNPDVLRKSGLRHVECDDLIEMNDTERQPFTKIADYIEENI